MKRLLGILAFGTMVAAAFGQAPFTIVSPRNYNPDTNAPLSRERVVLKFPKNSVPSGGYIGVFMGSTRGDKVESEKFIEATVPPIEGNYYVYTLDTKARQIADGMYTIRAVLYVDYSDRPREISSTQVAIRVANQSSIKIPASGLSLRYGFKTGQELKYRLDRREAVSTISSKQNSLGGRAAELPLESDVLRMIYAVDGVYSNGDSLIRMQPLPLAGKDYLYIRVSGSDTPEKFYSYEMAPVYMRMSNTGQEVFGAIPEAVASSQFVPITAGGGSRVDLYANFPLPSLPSKPVKPGDSWQTRFLMGTFNLDDRLSIDHVTEKIPARGEFVDVEYEQGHPCAKLHQTITEGSKTPEGMKLSQQGREFNDDKLSIDQTVWFALDTRKVIKVVEEITIDTKEEAQSMGFGGGSGSGGAGAPGMSGPSGSGGGGKPSFGSGGGAPRTGPGNSGGAGGDLQRGRAGGQGGPGRGNMPPGVPGGAGMSGPSGPGGFGGGRGSGAPAASAQYYRYRYQLIFTLEN
jgi:hypothetical protein